MVFPGCCMDALWILNKKKTEIKCKQIFNLCCFILTQESSLRLGLFFGSDAFPPTDSDFKGDCVLLSRRKLTIFQLFPDLLCNISHFFAENKLTPKCSSRLQRTEKHIPERLFGKSLRRWYQNNNPELEHGGDEWLIRHAEHFSLEVCW